jgi:hypothetical protein
MLRPVRLPPLRVDLLPVPLAPIPRRRPVALPAARRPPQVHPPVHRKRIERQPLRTARTPLRRRAHRFICSAPSRERFSRGKLGRGLQISLFSRMGVPRGYGHARERRARMTPPESTSACSSPGATRARRDTNAQPQCSPWYSQCSSSWRDTLIVEPGPASCTAGRTPLWTKR